MLKLRDLFPLYLSASIISDEKLSTLLMALATSTTTNTTTTSSSSSSSSINAGNAYTGKSNFSSSSNSNTNINSTSFDSSRVTKISLDSSASAPPPALSSFLSSAIEGIGDLQRAKPAALQAAKARMDVVFDANRILPGMPGYIYDKRVEFNTDESAAPSDWDD